MNIDRVSIVIPTLNEEKLISRTLSQYSKEIKDEYNLEIIVSDGGSTDSTLSRLNGVCDSVITENLKKQNIARGRNIGAKNSHGDVLIFFNADTKVENMRLFLERTIDIMKTGRYAAISFKIKVFPEEEKLSDRMFHNFYNNYVRLINKAGIGMARGECHILLRKHFENAGGYNENLIAGEDFDLYRRLRKFGKIYYCNDMPVYESPRRYRAFGYAKVFSQWAKNAVWIMLFNKSYQKSWDPVR
jgi:glycosyltransferase involved in cell wall biosynthesis